MSIDSWLLFCLTEAVLCFTPGPAVLLVVSLSLTRSASGGLYASLGVVAANALYFAFSATGLGAVLLASWELFLLIKWLGAAYLIWIGIGMILAAPNSKRSVANHVDTPIASHRTHLDFFSCGFLTQGANPKALVFFTAILPQFIDPTAPVAAQVLVLCLSSVVIEFIVLTLYVAVCHRAGTLVRQPGFAAPLERLGGLLLVGAGIRLAADHRR